MTSSFKQMIYEKIEFVLAVAVDQESLKKANLRLSRHPCVSSGECRLKSMKSMT